MTRSIRVRGRRSVVREGATRVTFGRPADRSVEAYRDFVLGMVRALTGKEPEDELSAEEWQADCQAYYASAKDGDEVTGA